SGAEVWGDAYHHGTPLGHALAEGLIEHGQLYQIAVRATWGSRGDGAAGDRHGARRFSMEDVDRHGIVAIAREVRARAAERPLYLTFDIDAVDPAYAPGTGTPVPGGLTARQAIALVRGLAGINLAGMDVVEVLPALDHADMTGNLAAYLLYESVALLGVFSMRSRSSGVSSPRS